MGYSAYEVLNTLVLYQGVLLARHVCSHGKKTPAAIKKETQTFLFITRLAVFLYILSQIHPLWSSVEANKGRFGPCLYEKGGDN